MDVKGQAHSHVFLKPQLRAGQRTGEGSGLELVGKQARQSLVMGQLEESVHPPCSLDAAQETGWKGREE